MPFLAWPILPTTRRVGAAASAATAAASAASRRRRGSFGAIAVASVFSDSNAALTSAGMSVLPAISVVSCVICRLSDATPAAASVVALLQVVHLHRHVVELLALRFGEHDFRIADDAQRLGLDRLAVDDERDVVAARQHERARGCRRRRRRIRRHRHRHPRRRTRTRTDPAGWLACRRWPPPPDRRPPAPGKLPTFGAAIGCTRRSQHAELMPGLRRRRRDRDLAHVASRSRR